jgi:hypothetical protein
VWRRFIGQTGHGWAAAVSGPFEAVRLEAQNHRRQTAPQAGARASQDLQPVFKALEAWVKAQTGVDKLEWLNAAQAGQCIEQLKLWLARKTPLPDAKVICADVVAKGGA